MTKTQQHNDFQDRLTSWIDRVERDMTDFVSGHDTSPYRLASSLASLWRVAWRVATRGADHIPDIDITLRERLADIQVKAELLKASGYDLEEELPF